MSFKVMYVGVDKTYGRVGGGLGVNGEEEGGFFLVVGEGGDC